MPWTYDPSQLATVPLYQLRALIGDTLPAQPQFQDAELTFCLSQRASIWGAAALACRALSAQLSRQVDTTIGTALKTSKSQGATAYLREAIQFEQIAAIRGGAVPYAGGISVMDKVRQIMNSDRVQPQFAVGMDDDMLPVPSTEGAETAFAARE